MREKVCPFCGRLKGNDYLGWAMTAQNPSLCYQGAGGTYDEDCDEASTKVVSQLLAAIARAERAEAEVETLKSRLASVHAFASMMESIADRAGHE